MPKTIKKSPGRPPHETPATKRINVYLTAPQDAWLAEQQPNKSEAVRNLIERERAKDQ